MLVTPHFILTSVLGKDARDIKSQDWCQAYSEVSEKLEKQAEEN